MLYLPANAYDVYCTIIFLGASEYSSYFGESGIDYSPKIYNVTAVTSSLVGRAIEKLPNNSLLKKDKIIALRKEATVSCKRNPNYPQCSNKCLFNIRDDPCETTDISDEYPEVQ